MDQWGAAVARVYRNDGQGVFTDVQAGLPGVGGGAVAWGDDDGDGDLDLILTGAATGGEISRIYRNDGGVFADIEAGLPGIREGAAAWGDYDNDGDLDLLLAGTTTGLDVTRIYSNDGGGAFTDPGVALPQFGSGAVAWGDYDNDGDLDLLLTGYVWPSRVTSLRNDGEGFSPGSMPGWPAVDGASAAWGDYDNDGDLDLLLNGYGRPPQPACGAASLSIGTTAGRRSGKSRAGCRAARTAPRRGETSTTTATWISPSAAAATPPERSATPSSTATRAEASSRTGSAPPRRRPRDRGLGRRGG